MSSFRQATAVTPVAADEYAVDLDAGFGIGGKPNGGYLLAILARAGCDAVEAEHPLAISAHYMRAPEAGPARVRVQPVRRGRRVSTVRATLWQAGKPCIETLLSAGALATEVADHVLLAPPPDLPEPDACASGAHPEFPVELMDKVDLRIDPATAPFPEPGGTPMLRGWFRWRDGTEPDVPTLLVAVDAAPPTVFNLGCYGWAPTVELTCLLRGVPAPGWLRFEVQTKLVAGGWFDEDATVWDSTGRVVAQARQLALSGS